MFKSLQIQNFQSHENTLLEFDPGVNVIVGSSDSGKTAILRALRWLLTNRPGGDSFRSNWGGDTIVNLHTEEGIIKRSKTAKDNMYVLNNQEFKAMGMDVPEEVKLLLNMNEVNLQGQLDAPFLLSNSSGEVAQYFNQIIQLDVIDIGRKNIEKWYRQLESQIHYKESEKERLENTLPQYEHLAKFEIDIESIEGLEERQKQIGVRIGKIKQWISSYETIQNSLEEYSEILLLEKPVNNLIELFQQKKEQERKKINLQELINSYGKIQNQLDKNNEIISSEKQVHIIMSLYTQQKETQKQESALSQILTSFERKKETIKEKEIEIVKMQKIFVEYMPDICPLCEQRTQ